jgi:hypothetical protein
VGLVNIWATPSAGLLDAAHVVSSKLEHGLCHVQPLLMPCTPINRTHQKLALLSSQPDLGVTRHGLVWPDLV